VFSHNDLGIEHVLVDPDTGAITGIIDRSDAAMVDPAYDVGLLYRDLGPVALDAILRSEPGAGDDGLRERAVFYARCNVLEDLAYGYEAGRPEYVDKSLAALRRLFAR
jgi:aminoglycoside phosphotransferase (APT) family kinase protein